MILKKIYKKEIEEVLKKIKENIEKEGFKVSVVHKVHESLKKAGKDLGFKAYIVEFCNPELAYKVLNINKEIINFMPCKIVLYENNEEVVVSSFLPIEHLMEMKNKEIRNIGEEVAQIIKRILEL